VVNSSGGNRSGSGSEAMAAQPTYHACARHHGGQLG
jgi:hypothetical protein